MRGNWETAEAMVLVPKHNLQQQQHSILEDHQRHPLHLSTTPAWGIADRTVVKEEPLDDKTSDSGVSPDHYSNSASPKSHRSLTVNGSLSPSSATSQDSNVMQCASYNQYSSESIYKNCNVPIDFTRRHSHQDISMHHHLHQSPHEHQTMDIVCDGMNNESDEVNGHQYIMPPESSPMDAECNRASPAQSLQSDQADQNFDGTEEPGVRVPRVNSQGKVKTFKCKQCHFTSITKLEFWDHSRGHIKEEKLLICPKCPFVTEYKHHLEYHLRNHFGSKPFKCDKCSYSCVNKSMLNSHLKSHSNVYQYRCANCSYATKYLHSLKLHLRKYNHQPAMVLNADGTPNPLPIVDVYGTRRGPKQKTVSSKITDGVKPDNIGHQSPIHQQTIAPPQLSPGINPMNVMSPFTDGNGINPLMALHYNHLYNANFSMRNPFTVPDEATEKKLEQIRQSLCVEYAKAMVTEKMNTEISHDGSQFTNIFNFNNNALKATDTNVNITNINGQFDMRAPSMTPESSPESKTTPLDLSKPDIVNNNNNSDNVQDHHQENIRKQMNVTAAISVSPRTSGTSRRKGKAFKLAVREIENESEEENRENIIVEPPTTSPILKQEDNKDSVDKNINGIETSNSSNSEFACQFCEIAFGNEVMYTVHMGYHGYQNPFTCNMCGHQCDDKVSFFLHIARSKHA